MLWQDVALAVLSFTFGVLLLYALHDHNGRVHRHLSVTAFILFLAHAVLHAWMGYWLVTVVDLFPASVWLAIAARRNKEPRRNPFA